MRALVTGGAGYFGELLSTKLLERGYWIRIFDVNRPTLTCPGIEVIQGDIHDNDSLHRLYSTNTTLNTITREDSFYQSANLSSFPLYLPRSAATATNATLTIGCH